MSNQIFVSDEYNIAVWKHETGFSVSMPHQCDRWHITKYYDYVPLAEAIESLKQFVAEANAALTMLYREKVVIIGE